MYNFFLYGVLKFYTRSCFTWTATVGSFFGIQKWYAILVKVWCVTGTLNFYEIEM